MEAADGRRRHGRFIIPPLSSIFVSGAEPRPSSIVAGKASNAVWWHHIHCQELEAPESE